MEHFIESLSKIFDKNPQGTVISNLDKKDNPIVYCNKAFCRMTGYPPSETLGRNCRFLQGDEQDQAGLVSIRWAIKNQQETKVIL
ncbi:MAG: PAS domain-containing protein [Balneolaceae bacterium]|nr:PAS domain-containing protein [Balneolaceae bacterium]